jgi:hypothetical protein
MASAGIHTLYRMQYSKVLTDTPKAYGGRGGITFGDVSQGADALFRAR